jgi:DNA-directed RNA polymerase subunit F
MKYIKLFEEFSAINEAQETLRKKLKDLSSENKEGLSSEDSKEAMEKLLDEHGDSKKHIEKFFDLLNDKSENCKELADSEGDEKEELESKAEELNDKIHDLIKRLG